MMMMMMMMINKLRIMVLTARIRIILPYPPLHSKHGDDMIFSTVNTDDFEKARGCGARNNTPICKQKIRTAFPYCNRGDDMIFTISMDGFKKAGGWGEGHPSHLQTA